MGNFFSSSGIKPGITDLELIKCTINEKSNFDSIDIINITHNTPALIVDL